MINLEVLIERWQAGDQRAAEDIYNQYKGQTFRLAYGLLGNTEDAEEGAQDALTYALLHIHQFDERRSKFTTWLHTITVSRSRDILRRRRLTAFSLIAWGQNRQSLPDSQLMAEQNLSKMESQHTIWAAVQNLPPVLREVIVLRHWGGHTYQEIAEIVGCPMKTAQSRVRLAHQNLARILGEVNLQQILEETR